MSIAPGLQPADRPGSGLRLAASRQSTHLQYNQLELISLTAASVISALVSLDGESDWLEGAMLLVVYCILGLAFFFLLLKL